MRFCFYLGHQLVDLLWRRAVAHRRHGLRELALVERVAVVGIPRHKPRLIR